MGPRWKGNGSEAIAHADPMSKIISQLQSSLIQSETQGLLSGCDVLLNVGPEETDLLLRSCLGRPIITADKNKHWYQINLEEAFYMSHYLKCVNIVGENKCPKSNDELWEYIRSKRKAFPESYKAYSHLRAKNWVVRSASHYGVDFVVYHHHPSLVHSEYAVIVLSEGDGDLDTNVRLRVWSDIHGTVRLGDSVAKTLLILNIKKNGCDAISLSCLDQYTVEERTITRWNPKQCKEDLTLVNSYKFSTFSPSLLKAQSTVVLDGSVSSPKLSQVSTVRRRFILCL